MPRPDPIVVTAEGGYPYSKGLMAQSLMACGIPPDRAYRVARLIDAELRRGERQPLSTAELRARAEALLGEAEPADVERYRRSKALRRGDRTLVVLVGGAPGVGKSAVATQLAHRLGITRIASTDTIREVLRTTLAPGIAPSIATSSFEAHRALPPEAGAADPLLVGFFEQADTVSRAARGIVARSLRERVPLVLEGVHVIPGAGLGPVGDPRAVVVEALLVVADEAEHRSHFRFRAEETADGRPLERYLDRFPEIRRIQAALESAARRADAPVIEAARLDSAVRVLLDLVLERVASDDQAPVGAGRRP